MLSSNPVTYKPLRKMFGLSPGVSIVPTNQIEEPCIVLTDKGRFLLKYDEHLFVAEGSSYPIKAQFSVQKDIALAIYKIEGELSMQTQQFGSEIKVIDTKVSELKEQELESSDVKSSRKKKPKPTTEDKQ